MNACSELYNQIFPRNLISIINQTSRDYQNESLYDQNRWRHLLFRSGLTDAFSPFKLYKCRYLRGGWKWCDVANLPKYCWNESQRRIMNILQKGVIKYFEEDYKKQPKHNALSPIQISNAPGSHADKINGVYYPILELCPAADSPMIYLKKSFHSEVGHFNMKNDRTCIWLYWVPREDGVHGRWWVGNTYFMKLGQAHGFMKQGNATPLFGEIADAQLHNIHWRIWTGNDADHASPGRWLDDGPYVDEINPNPERPMCVKRLQYNYDGSFKADPNQEIKDELENLKIATKDSLDNYHLIAQKLWNYFPQEQRCCLWEKEKALQVLLDKNKICKCCFMVSKNKVKCIHFDCPGACLECTESNGGGNGDCIACKRDQIVKCPICFEEEKPKYLYKFKCRHFVCLSCFIAAFEKKKPIKKCPCCRKAIYGVDV